jgi:predicted nucleic acid-binding protein
MVVSHSAPLMSLAVVGQAHLLEQLYAYGILVTSYVPPHV